MPRRPKIKRVVRTNLMFAVSVAYADENGQPPLLSVTPLIPKKFPERAAPWASLAHFALQNERDTRIVLRRSALADCDLQLLASLAGKSGKLAPPPCPR